MTTFERFLRQVALTTTDSRIPRVNTISRRGFAATLGLLAFGRPLRGSALSVGCDMGLPSCESSGGGWPHNICGGCDEVDPWECECQVWNAQWVFCCECDNCTSGPANCEWNSSESQYATYDCFDESRCDVGNPPCPCEKPDEECPDDPL
jgi:hypothetical protein